MYRTVCVFDLGPGERFFTSSMENTPIPVQTNGLFFFFAKDMFNISDEGTGKCLLPFAVKKWIHVHGVLTFGTKMLSLS